MAPLTLIPYLSFPWTWPAKKIELLWENTLKTYSVLHVKNASYLLILHVLQVPGTVTVQELDDWSMEITRLPT